MCSADMRSCEVFLAPIMPMFTVTFYRLVVNIEPEAAFQADGRLTGLFGLDVWGLYLLLLLLFRSAPS